MSGSKKDNSLRNRRLAERIIPPVVILAWLMLSYYMSVGSESPRTRFGLLLFLGFVAIVAVVAFLERKGYGTDTRPKVVVETVRAHRFELLDGHGHARASISLDKDGVPLVTYRDSEGHARKVRLEDRGKGQVPGS